MVFSPEIYLSILIFLVKLIMVKKITKGVIVSDLTKKVLAVYHSPANECIIRQLYHYSYEYVERIIDDIAPGCRLSGEDREFLIDFINYGFIGILIKWVREGMKYDPEELIKHLATVSDEEFRVIINRMEIQSKN